MLQGINWENGRGKKLPLTECAMMLYHALYRGSSSCKDWDSGDCHPENLAFVILLINAVLQQLPMLKDWDAHRWSASVCSFCFHKYLFPQSAENPIESSPCSCGLLLEDHTQMNMQSNIWYFWTFLLDFFPKIHVELAWCWVSWWEQSLMSSYGQWIFCGQFSTPKVHSILFYIIRILKKQQKVLNPSMQRVGSRKYHRIAMCLVWSLPQDSKPKS